MPVEVRYQGTGKARHIDEICASAVSLHIEQMDGPSWYLGITEEDGTYHQFWFGADNMRSRVSFRHQETTPAAALKETLG